MSEKSAFEGIFHDILYRFHSQAIEPNVISIHRILAARRMFSDRIIRSWGCWPLEGCRKSRSDRQASGPASNPARCDVSLSAWRSSRAAEFWATPSLSSPTVDVVRPVQLDVEHELIRSTKNTNLHDHPFM